MDRSHSGYHDINPLNLFGAADRSAYLVEKRAAYGFDATPNYYYRITRRSRTVER